ncbi:MAG: HlyC/CorC family transporter [Candidatus Promineofilum sp.]|nr:HlyC/CorC family transporter [Promineifilum sp.]MBP9657092.1 HlyC/CorC family transporter [Promineifilum sp.]
MIIEIGILVILILINGLFALAEMSIVSSRRERLRMLVDDGNRGAATALRLSQEPTVFLSTVQVGITLIGILAGAFGSASLSDELSQLIAPIPIIGPYSRTVALALVVGVITFFQVVVGELVPKRLALRNPERIAAAVAGPMSVLSRIARPVVRLLALTTRFFLRVLGVRDDISETTVTEEEIKVLVEQGAQAGVFEEAERDMVESIFRFGDRQLRSLMTPRTEIVWLDINDPEEEIRDTVSQSHHSRFPVCDDALDRVIGIVQAKDMLSNSWTDQPFDLKSIMRPPLFLPETMSALRALERFKQTGIQEALLVDEFGGIEGLVTLIDMMEAIVGDIPTAEEIAEPPVVKREDGSWLVDGSIDIDDLKELLEVGELPDEGDYQTLGGFIVLLIGRLPRAGDRVDWQDYRFEVVDMDGYRIDKVLLSKLPAA